MTDKTVRFNLNEDGALVMEEQYSYQPKPKAKPVEGWKELTGTAREALFRRYPQLRRKWHRWQNALMSDSKPSPSDVQKDAVVVGW